MPSELEWDFDGGFLRQFWHIPLDGAVRGLPLPYNQLEDLWTSPRAQDWACLSFSQKSGGRERVKMLSQADGTSTKANLASIR